MFRFQFAVFPRCTLHQDIAKLRSPELEFTTDVKFLVGKNEVPISAHMAIVAARCDWLRERILDAKQSSSTDDAVHVKIPEAEPKPFTLWYVIIYKESLSQKW